MKVFISSVYLDSQHPGAERHLAVRRSLYERGSRLGIDMWVAEYRHPELTSQTPWRKIVDTCVRGLEGCDLFVAILLRRWGSAVEIDNLGPAAVSFLEIELFHASLQRIPAVFLEAEDFQPDTELASLIHSLKRVTSPAQWIKQPEAQLERTALDLIEAVRANKGPGAKLSGFGDARSDDVSFARVNREITSTRMSFLEGFSPPAPNGSFSAIRVLSLLEEVEGANGDESEIVYADRLSRLWIALRELAKLPVGDIDPGTASLWLRLAGSWTSPAAWLRLHGPLRLGVLAALHTRMDLTRRQKITAPLPYGAFASEAYSIGKASDTWRWKVRRFEAARRLATKQAAAGGRDPSGAWLIRASAGMHLAALGQPWLAIAALNDYGAALTHREKIGASDSAIGEAMSELGYAGFVVGRALFWRRHNALGLMRDGVRLLENDNPGRRPGFVKRAKEKFIDALEREGRLAEADAQRVGAIDLADRHRLPKG